MLTKDIGQFGIAKDFLLKHHYFKHLFKTSVIAVTTFQFWGKEL